MSIAISRRAQPVLTVLALLALLALGACSSGGGGGGGSDDDGGGTTFSAPDCSSGTTSSDIADDVPDWIKTNFTCIAATVSGSDVIIKSRSLPPYLSIYWDQEGSNSERYEDDMPSQHSANPNLISSQEYTLTIPMTPLTEVGELTATYDEDEPDFAGIAIDGVGILNAFAQTPDLLANEAWTLDNAWGHPTQNGFYHYHVEPVYLSNNNANLIGVSLDGLPIYGAKDAATYGECDVEECIPSDLGDDPENEIANFHCHETPDFPDGVCHYHVLTGYVENTTKDIGPVDEGEETPLRYMVKYVAGNQGTFSLPTAAKASLRRMRTAAMLANAANCGPNGTVIAKR